MTAPHESPAIIPPRPGNRADAATIKAYHMTTVPTPSASSNGASTSILIPPANPYAQIASKMAASVTQKPTATVTKSTAM